MCSIQMTYMHMEIDSPCVISHARAKHIAPIRAASDNSSLREWIDPHLGLGADQMCALCV